MDFTIDCDKIVIGTCRYESGAYATVVWPPPDGDKDRIYAFGTNAKDATEKLIIRIEEKEWKNKLKRSFKRFHTFKKTEHPIKL